MNTLKTTFSLAALLSIVALAPGGEPSHDALLKKMVGTLDELTKTLGSITTQESADAAKPDLAKAAKEWVGLRAQVDKLPPPASREEKERLEKEFKSKLEASQKKLFGEVVRVRNVPGGNEALKEIRGVLARPMKE